MIEIFIIITIFNNETYTIAIYIDNKIFILIINTFNSENYNNE